VIGYFFGCFKLSIREFWVLMDILPRITILQEALNLSFNLQKKDPHLVRRVEPY
jgi:hypothetical protein